MAYKSNFTGKKVVDLLNKIDALEETPQLTESDISNMGFTKNLGTVTEIKMNGVSKGTSGVIDLGTVITEHQDISNKQDEIKDLSTIREGALKGLTALQNVPSEYVTESELNSKNFVTTSQLNNKVDKVTGKQLSTEDFTTALKSKLQSLNNYDDTAIISAISSLEDSLNTLVNGNASIAIDSFNEIISFLEGIKDSQDLASIIASIEQQIAKKQNTIYDIDTIRAGAEKGATALQSIPPEYITEYELGLKNYATVSQLNDKQSAIYDLDEIRKGASAGSTALQEEQYKGTVTGIKINNDTKLPSDGIVDIGTVIISHQDISGKQDTLISGVNIKTFNGESILGEGNIVIQNTEGGGSLPEGVIDEEGYLYSNGEKIDMRFTRSLLPTGTSIPAKANLNTKEYLKIGKYYCSLNADAKTITNCPVNVAFSMEVFNPLGTNVDDEDTKEYTYRMRVLTQYDTGQQYTQFCRTSGTPGSWTYDSWYITTRAKFTLNSSKNDGSAAVGSATQGAYVDSTGTLTKMTYTLAKSVPSNAVFTDTDTKVTSVENHYAPEEDEDAVINAPEGEVVVGINRDAAGHVIGVVTTPQKSGGGDYDDTEIQNKITELEKNKQNVISDIETIKEGASKGFTALQGEDVDDTVDDVETTDFVSSINYDLNVKAINHRGYSEVAPENTIPAYIMSKEKGFTYVEGDVSFTKDSVAVLLHDATIDRTSDGSGDITTLMYQEVLQYDFGSWKDAKYTGVKIPTFKEWIVLCKNLGLHPYIELKSAGNYTQSQINQIVAEVEECGMKGKVTYISFSNTYLGYVKNADAYARLGLLANPLNSSKISQGKALKLSTNEVFMDAKLSTVTNSLISSCISNGLPLEVWTVNTENEIISMPSYVSGVTSDYIIAGKVLYNNALVYVPPTSNWNPTTAISLDKTSLSFFALEPVTLIAAVVPSDSSESVVWKSSNTAVATVVDGVVTPIAEGSCIITATSGNYSASCSVVVSLVSYSISCNLEGCSLSNSIDKVVVGGSWVGSIVPDEGYSIKNAVISITMNGIDITSTSYNNGVISIANVTGDIIINVKCIAVPVYTIVRNFVGCESDSMITQIGEGNPHSETITALSGYKMDGAEVAITMGGIDIASFFSNGVLNIPEVTGNVVINVVAVESLAPVALIDWDVKNAANGVIKNLGSGGSTYDGKISTPKSGDSYESDVNGIRLNNHAYADTAYGFSKSKPFTIIVEARISEDSTNTYQRVFRTNADTPCLFQSNNIGAFGAKLAGQSGNGFTTYNPIASTVNNGSSLNTCYLKDGPFDYNSMHKYIWTSDGTIIKWYVDGELYASQNASALTSSASVGIGDTDSSKNYYAKQIEVAMFKIYDITLNEEEINAIINEQ